MTTITPARLSCEVAPSRRVSGQWLTRAAQVFIALWVLFYLIQGLGVTLAFDGAPVNGPFQYLLCIIQFVRLFSTTANLKFTGNNFGCTVRCGCSCQSFSQSASDGTVTSACFAYARCTALELWPHACCANRAGHPHFKIG